MTKGPLAFHAMLLGDTERMSAYQHAIAATVRPGDVVLDMGTGSGILALFACQAGARRVYAVDREPILDLARQGAAANGFEDRIVWLQTDAADLDLPEPVDVIVSELIGKALLGQRQAEIIGGCRDRFLKPGGALVPRDGELWVAPFDDAGTFAETQAPPAARYGLDFEWYTSRLAHAPLSARLSAAALLADGQRAYRYDALATGGSDQFATTLTFAPQRCGTLHGFVLWFRAELAEGIILTNAPPGLPSWDHLCLPLPAPGAVERGDAIELRLQARDDTQMPFLWAWSTTVRRADLTLAAHRQSSFMAQLLPRGVTRTARRPAVGE
jgi:SAM-dependent methyltransferase